VFGEGDFIANVIWQKVYSPKNTAQHFSDDHEYVLVYAKSREKWRPNPVPRKESQTKAYKNPDEDPRGPWKPGDLSARNFYGAGTYAITCPSGRVIESPPAGMYWRVSKEKLVQLDADNRIWWGKDGNNVPAIKRFLTEVRSGVVPQTLWSYDEVGHTQDAKKQLLDVLSFDRSEDVFSTPKPVQLIQRILQIATGPNDTVLDFFAGSGTLGQAVAKLNAEDGGDRKFILVSSTEATVDQPDKNLCRDVCAERVRRVLGGYTNAKGEAVPGLGGGFAYLRTQRLPRHRLTRRLGHAEIWNALRLMHRFPIDATAPGTLAVVVAADQALAYLPEWREPAVEQLLSWASDQAGKRCAIYSWTPQRLAERLPGHDIQPIPETLQLRFGRGRA